MQDERLDEWRLFCERHFPQLQSDCGRESSAGVADVEAWRDWSEFETTPDQQRIESYIARFDLRGKRILHVGVGNSMLAKRFHNKLETLTGTTVVSAELRKGTELGLPNYSIFMHNKYLRTGRPSGKYHFILDNNLTTFCCCLKHFRVMMGWYASSLEHDGQIVTDRVGLGWITELESQDRRWKFTFEDLNAMAPFFKLLAYKVDENIYVLSRKGADKLKSTPALCDVYSRAKRAILSRCSFLTRSWLSGRV